MKRIVYLSVFERTDNGYSVYFPDLPGCITVGDSIEETTKNAKECLALHVYGLLKDNEQLPTPSETIKDIDSNDMIVPISVFPELEKRKFDNKKVKTNCTISNWVKELGEQNNVNFSQLLENAILEYLDIN